MSNILQTFEDISYSQEKLEEGKIKLNVVIGDKKFRIAKEKVYKRLAPAVKIKGFRGGMAPKNLIIAHLGPNLFEEIINELVPQCTIEVIKREKLFPLDKIAYEIKKIAEGSGIEYSATFSALPEFDLPDLSKIRMKKEKIEVRDEEVKVVIQQMFDEKQKSKSGSKETKDKKDKSQLDGDWIKGLNLGVDNLKELEEKVKQELVKQKETVAKNKSMKDVIEQIVTGSKFDAPEILVEKEVERSEALYKKKIVTMGVKLDDFLKGQKTSLLELRETWEIEASERVKTEIVFMKISEEYNIKVESSEIEKQLDSVREEKLKKQYQTSEGKRYIRDMLLRQKVIQKILELVKDK